MKCDRESCSWLVAPGREYRHEGRVFCSERCATECTDEQCVCTPCDCPT